MATTFAFPIPESGLSNNRIHLTTFDPAVHIPPYLAGASPHPVLFDWLPYGPFNTATDIEAFHNARIVSDPKSYLFAIITKCDTAHGPAGSFAGVVGLLAAQPENAACEIGYITVLPPFQRSYVNTNAVGLLLHYLLDSPGEGGLGLRRVVWQANADNAKSISAGRRLGFHFEGTVRWQRILRVGDKGAGIPAREKGKAEGVKRWPGPGRHTALLSMCWDDWVEDGKKEFVKGLMER